MKKSKINWEKTSAAIFRADLKRLRAVVEFDAQKNNLVRKYAEIFRWNRRDKRLALGRARVR